MSLVSFRTIRKVGIVTFEESGEAVRHPWGTLQCEHRFNRVNLNDLTAVVSRIEASLHALTGVVFTGRGRFFSNGFDLGYFKASSHAEAVAVQTELEFVISRILKFPVVTVAALNGHTVAAGALFALAFDARVMNARHGLFFVPAAKLGLSYSPGFIELGRSRMQPQAYRDLLLFGRRYPATDAHAAGIVDALADGQEAVLLEAIRLCELNEIPQSDIKVRLNKRIIEAFENASPDERDMGWARLFDGSKL